MKRALLAQAISLLFISTIYSQTPNRYDIVIDEIMADPTPQIGMPTNEWIEIKNVSALAVNLQGCRISDLTNTSGAMPSYILKPDSFVIVCTASAQSAMAMFGPTITVTSFPSLDNDGDQLSISTGQGKIIHAVKYSTVWYRDELKKAGGWTLEMIDTKNVCSGFTNWQACSNIAGGTPGKKNAADGTNTDKQSPKLVRAFAIDSVTISLVFDEPLDSAKAVNILNYSFSDGIMLSNNAVAIPPLFDRINLKLNTAIGRNKIYTVTVKQLTDCAGNAISSDNTARVGLSSIAENNDLVINEVLFNPKPGGTDFVEVYNRSNKIIDLKQLHIANRNSSNVISSIEQVSIESILFFPQDLTVLTDDASMIVAQYFVPHQELLIPVSAMPSFSDDKGNVVLLNAQGSIIDELHYDEKWHFKLISNNEGVSLERIDYNAATQNESNWHSAATSVGYATPTYKNSQSRSDAILNGGITLTPEIVSPDNDALDDFATIDYSFPEPGYVANITIFDIAGRAVRYLQRNALCGLKGNYRWDGLGELNQKLPVGIYIFYTEIFSLNGKAKRFKNVIVLARKS